MKIHLNDYIKVRLTELGEDIYYHQYDEINAQYPGINLKSIYPKKDAEGYTQLLLWEFINLYHDYMTPGAPTIIDPLVIEYDPSTSIIDENKNATMIFADKLAGIASSLKIIRFMLSKYSEDEPKDVTSFKSQKSMAEFFGCMLDCCLDVLPDASKVTNEQGGKVQ